jgi:prephenate dehydrogenase
MKRVGIIGTGLIGGSIALALKKKRGSDFFTLGFDLSRESLEKAVRAGAIDLSCGSIEELVKKSDIVIVATPFEAVPSVFEAIGPYLEDEKVVTDVCSLKKPVQELAEKIFPDPAVFVGGHPMAGSERGGFDAAHHELFVGRSYIITPTPQTSEKALAALSGLIKVLGARPVMLSPEEHDLAVAFSSHLTHIISWCLVATALRERIAEIGARFGGPSYRDATRVAMASPEMWASILKGNRENILKAIEIFEQELKEFKRKIDRGSSEEILNMLLPIREKRFEIYRSLEPGAEIYRLEVVIPNRPGQLARVATLLSGEGVNIENIEMVHGEGQGLLFIDIAGRETAEKALSILIHEGFDAAIEAKGE